MENNKLNINNLYEEFNIKSALEDTINWEGHEIKVKKILTLEDSQVFEDAVVIACFDSDNICHSWKFDFITRLLTICLYTNIEFNNDYETAYSLLYCTPIFNSILENIEHNHYMALINGCKNKIDYIINSNIESINRGMIQMQDTMENAIKDFSEKLSGLFDGVTNEDIKKVVAAISDSNIDGAQLLKAYLDNNN